ncbi:MAG: nitrilase-related carbon-nitrogen hydrolase [Verrucomicrobiota bacterium]
MKVALFQWDLCWEDPEANYEKMVSLLERERPEPGTFCVFPETASTGFTMAFDQVATEVDGAYEKQLTALSDRFECPLFVGLARKYPEGVRNEALTFLPGAGPVHRYAKVQPFALGGELEVVIPGDRLFLFEYGGFTICPLICYDLRFPEWFREGARLGAEVFVVIASWPEKRHHHWQLLLQARAIENQAYVLGVNRCGEDPHFQYRGGSMIIDPLANAVQEAGEEEAVLKGELDRESLRQWREGFPALTDCRHQSAGAGLERS